MKLIYCVFVLIYSVKGQTLCNDGWLPYGGSCYFFHHGKMPFVQAENFCRQHNAHLVHVNDAKENAFLKDRMRDLKGDNWWVGITDEAIEGVWQWYDTNEDTTFLDFRVAPTGHNSEDCAYFAYGYDFKWDDYICTVGIAAPLCEYVSEGCISQPHIGVIG